MNYPSNFYFTSNFASASPSTEENKNVNVVPIYNSKNCKYSSKISIPSKFFSVGQMCLLRLCNATLVFNKYTQMANFVETQMSAPSPNIDHKANCTVFFDFDKGNIRELDETQLDNSSKMSEKTEGIGRSFDAKRCF